MKIRTPARLMPITDTTVAPPAAWLERLEALCAGAQPGSVVVQLRDREMPIRERKAFGMALRALTLRHEQRLWVNDRLDLALCVGADGVHLPESGVSPSDARAYAKRQGRDWVVSVAVHAPERAAVADADAIVLSPIAAARKGRAALGAEGLARARAALGDEPGCALYALGGVVAGNAAGWLGAGADGVALVGGAFETGGLELLEALGIRR